MVYIVSSTFLSMLTVQSLYLLYQNKAMGVGLCQAYIACTNDTVRIRLILSRRVTVKPGQYVGLWMPAAGFCSFLQSHPYTVVSWSEGKQQHLDLLVKACKGSTLRLLALGKANVEPVCAAGEEDEYILIRDLRPHLALISGPHGRSVPVGDYRTVVMIASGSGIASLLPYLKQLYHSCKTRNRRIRMVWEPEDEGKSRLDWYLLTRADTSVAMIVAVMPLLNSALVEDTLDYGYVGFSASKTQRQRTKKQQALSISIYVKDNVSIESLGKRVTIYHGDAPDFEGILDAEQKGRYIDRVQEENGRREDMAVLGETSALPPSRCACRLHS
jgi:NAD(P)H-flavin reductase